MIANGSWASENANEWRLVASVTKRRLPSRRRWSASRAGITLRFQDAGPREAIPHQRAELSSPPLAHLHALLRDQRLHLREAFPQGTLVNPHQLLQLRERKVRGVDRHQRIDELRDVTARVGHERVPEGRGDLGHGLALRRQHPFHGLYRESGRPRQLEQAPHRLGGRRVHRGLLRPRRRGERQHEECDQGDRSGREGHGWRPALKVRSSRNSRCRRTSGHSPARMLYITISRAVPSRRMPKWRMTPSRFAPSASMARCDRKLKLSVRSPTTLHPRVSNAWPRSSSLQVVLTCVRWWLLPYHVCPISTRSIAGWMS